MISCASGSTSPRAGAVSGRLVARTDGQRRELRRTLTDVSGLVIRLRSGVEVSGRSRTPDTRSSDSLPGAVDGVLGRFPSIHAKRGCRDSQEDNPSGGLVRPERTHASLKAISGGRVNPDRGDAHAARVVAEDSEAGRLEVGPGRVP